MRARLDLIWEPYLKQTFLNAFSSNDLVHWTKHEHVLDVADVPSPRTRCGRRADPK